MKKSAFIFKKLIIINFVFLVWATLVHLYGQEVIPETEFNFHYPDNNLSDPSVVNQMECLDGQWTGATSIDWNTATNWCNGNIPTSSTNVIISSALFQPSINSNIVCNNITINVGASLTILGKNTLTVFGNWSNSGLFDAQTSTVIFKGINQIINGKTEFFNVIIGGTGIKTMTKDNFIVHGILSMEETGTISDVPSYGTNASLQYNTAIERTIGLEWPSLLSYLKDIIVKNTGIISIQSNKTLERCSLTVYEESTLNLSRYDISSPIALHLACGAYTKGSLITGTGTLTLAGNVYVKNSGHGIAGALISCPLVMKNSLSFEVENDIINENTYTDLIINGLSGPYFTLTKNGLGRINMGHDPINLLNLKINSGMLFIPFNGQVTIRDNTSVFTPNGLTIESSETGTGSFITAVASGTGMAKVECSMTDDAWHLVASPLSSQSISSFLLANGSVPTDTYANRGMRDYNPELNRWNDFFTNSTIGILSTGKGFCMRVRKSQAHKVSFSGLLQAGDITVGNLSAGNWNCIGNPFTSAIGINVASSSSNKFLTINSANLDPAYGAIYIWDQPDDSNGQQGKYTIISNASASLHAQQGQAFMVKMNTGATSISFNKKMQLHNSSLSLKSINNVWPTIELFASVDNLRSSTTIAFNEGMTNGLDPTYDAGLLKADDNLNLYTLLVNDYGIPFAIQALSENNYDRMVIPVGVDCLKGGHISFSAELLNLPSDCKVILEDKLNKTYTDLIHGIYSTDIMANSNNRNRFYLHTSYNTIHTGTETKHPIFDIWTDGNTKIIINGKGDNHTIATLYDVQGRTIVSQPLMAESNNTITLQGIKPGIYVLKVRDNGFIKVLKLNFTK